MSIWKPQYSLRSKHVSTEPSHRQEVPLYRTKLTQILRCLLLDILQLHYNYKIKRKSRLLNSSPPFMRSEGITEMQANIRVFLYTSPWRLEYEFNLFGETFCLQLQGS
jgi:hypothetical protein